MSSAHRYLPSYTVEDYQSWAGDWELWQGIPVSMSPSPFGLHQKIATRLATVLQNCIDSTGCEAVVLAEIDWIISENTVVRPDVTVLCGDAPLRHVETTPAIAAEILSPSTAARDRTSKFELYQEERVPWYLILDPDRKQFDAWSRVGSGAYQKQEFTGEAVLDICDGCVIQFAIDRLFA